MPEETRTFRIVVEGKGAQDALEALLQAFKRMEDAVVGVGRSFDVAVQKMVEPVTALTGAVQNLEAAIGRMAGSPPDLSQHKWQLETFKNDVLAMEETLRRHRATGMKGEVYRIPGFQGVRSRQFAQEQYFAGGLGPNVWSGIAEQERYVGTPSRPAREAQQYETLSAVAKELGVSMEELSAWTNLSADSFTSQGQTLREVLGVVETAEVQVGKLGQVEEQLAASAGQATAAMDQEVASTTRLTGATEMLAQVQTRQRSLWRQLMDPTALGGGEKWSQMVAEGARVAEQLGQQAGAFTRQMGAAIAEQRQRGGWTAATWYGPEMRPGLQRGPEQRAFGGRMWGLEETEALEQAMGRKVVVQALLARGATDVAEKFEKQFRITRSKEEVLREVAKTGVMTAEAEKELGLQAEGAGQKAGAAGNMFRYFGRYLLRYLFLWQMIQAVRGIMHSWFQAHLEMSDSLADFSWRVNATTQDVERYRDKLRDVSTMVGMPVAEIASPLAGRATAADLLRAAEASKIFGGSVEDWLRTLERGDASLDAFAHGLRISTLATEDYAKLIGDASGIAKEFNMSTEETIGLLSALPAIIKGDESDVLALVDAWAGLYEQNQLLMNLGLAPALTVGPGGGPQRRPMPEVMTEIGRLPIEQQRQLAVAIGLPDGKQQQFFLDAVSGWASVSQAIQGTAGAAGDMEDAIAGAAEKLSTHVDGMKASWTSLMETIGTTEWAIDWVDIVTMAFKGWQMIIEEINKALEGTGEILAAIPFIGPGMGISKGVHALAEEFRGGEKAARAEARAEATAAGQTAGAGAPSPIGAAYFPPMPVTRLPEGMSFAQVAAEMERVIDEVFTRPFQTATGEWIQVTKEQIQALRENTIVVDENGEAIGLLNAYAPALSMATENLRTEVARFNLERLRDIEPGQFDQAMRTILPMWEARLGAIEGFEEKPELFTFFVGQNDILRQQYATQTAMRYTLDDILEVEEKQLEGLWNIPAGTIMRVPLQSLDMLRWLQGAGGGGPVATDMMEAPSAAMENAANAHNVAAMSLNQSAVNLGTSATQLSSAAAMVGSMGAGAALEQPKPQPYPGVPLGPMTDEGKPLMQQVNQGPGRPIPGGGGKVTTPIPTTPAAGGVGAYAAQFLIRLVLESVLNIDGEVLARKVEEREVRQLSNVSRGRAGGALRP